MAEKSYFTTCTRLVPISSLNGDDLVITCLQSTNRYLKHRISDCANHTLWLDHAQCKRHQSHLFNYQRHQIPMTQQTSHRPSNNWLLLIFIAMGQSYKQKNAKFRELYFQQTQPTGHSYNGFDNILLIYS